MYLNETTFFFIPNPTHWISYYSINSLNSIISEPSCKNAGCVQAGCNDHLMRVNAGASLHKKHKK